jgi:Fe-S oxidoreductase
MALCIFDVFRAQIGEDFLDFLSENNVRVVYVQCPSAKI